MLFSWGALRSRQGFSFLTAGDKWGLDMQPAVWFGKREEGWHHLTVTYDGKQAEFYYDGKSDARTSAALVTTGTTLYLGARPVSDYTRRCTMDDFRLYTRALSAEEIEALYKLPKEQ